MIELSKETIEKSKKSIEINITIKVLPPTHTKKTPEIVRNIFWKPCQILGKGQRHKYKQKLNCRIRRQKKKIQLNKNISLE